VTRGPLLGGACSVLLLTSAAHAGDATLAETLFREGKALMEAKNYEVACPKLLESYRQDPATGTLLALGMCQERDGKLASAWATYHAVVGRAERDGRRDRAAAAERRAAALEARLSYLTVEVPADVAAFRGIVLTRDGVPLPRAAWGTAMPTDAGTHVVEVSADGRVPFRRTVELADSAREVVRVPMLEPTPASQPEAVAVPIAVRTPAPATAPAHGPAPAAERAKSTSSLSLFGILLGGAGLVALGGGTAFGIKAKNLDEQSREDGCDPETGYCSTDGSYEQNLDARAAGNSATALFVVGGALVATGFTLYLVGRAKDSSSASLGVSPLVAREAVGVRVRTGF
jgi:hypothetical protein